MKCDDIGALGFRIAQQEHWRQAEAVQDGRQPPVDPDGGDLEEIDQTVRIYHLHEVYRTIDGRQAHVSQRLVKRLGTDGSWESGFAVDWYRHDNAPPVALHDEIQRPSPPPLDVAI